MANPRFPHSIRPFFAVFCILCAGIVALPAQASLDSEYKNCKDLEATMATPECKAYFDVTYSGKIIDKCENAQTEYFYNGCPKIISFYGASEAGKDALCKTWAAERTTVKTSDQAYTRVECDARAAEKAAAYAASIAAKCKTYVPVSIPGTRYDPACVVSGVPNPGCDSVTDVECTGAGAGLGSAGALGMAGIVGPEVEGTKQVKRIEDALARAKQDPDVPKTSIAQIDRLLSSGRTLFKQLQDLTKKEGTKPDYLVRANEIVAQIKALADQAEILAGSSPGSAMTISNPLGANADIPTLIGRIISTFLGMVGAISLVVFVAAGLRYLTAGGSEAAVTQAKDAMKYAFIGITVILFAYIITNFFFTALLKP